MKLFALTVIERINGKIKEYFYGFHYTWDDAIECLKLYLGDNKLFDKYDYESIYQEFLYHNKVSYAQVDWEKTLQQAKDKDMRVFDAKFDQVNIKLSEFEFEDLMHHRKVLTKMGIHAKTYNDYMKEHKNEITKI